ncbi:Zn-dependent hydrolase [Candidatus Pacearchaeota archaeon]|jgi:L-ascorbate metabolism protein UlaG (beta-lactamase superfamily)|nr:Zn-dependent hydrolase [Candidatus Pacearchaeota archaeon]
MDVGDVKITFLGHDGFLFEHQGKRIVVDPYHVSEGLAKVDVVLLTHSHYDHCSVEDLQKLVRPGTMVVGPADVQSKVMKLEGVQFELIEVGDEVALNGVKVEAVAAYNKEKEFHPKEEGWLGYLIKFPGTVVYHAGDTDPIPEQKHLTGHGCHGKEFVCLLPVSGKYVMDAEEAAEVASLLSPDVAIPMHYGAGVAGTKEDAERFVELCGEVGVKAEILGKI